MRLTTILLGLGLFTAACAADVGGGAGSRTHKGSGSGSGSDTTDCERVDTDVTIRAWSDFDALPTGCWDLHAALKVQGPAITGLARLGDLIAVDELHLMDTGVSRIDTQNELEIYGELHVEGNAQLTSLDNLVGVQLADTMIVDNAALASAAVLRDVDRIDGDLTITGNPALTSLNLSKLATVHSVEIANDVALATVSGLPATDITGNLTLRGNRALTTVGTLSALYRITGNLVVDDNDALVNLGMFPSAMKWIDGGLTITNNQNLTDISQMRRLLGIGATVTIASNPSLSECRAYEVEQCVTTIGTVTIQNNKSSGTCNLQCN